MKFRQSFLAMYIGIAIFLADLASKYFVQEYLPRMNSILFWYPYGGIGIFKDFYGIEFSITHQINKGAAWGILSDWQHILLYFRIILVTGLLIYAIFINKRKELNIPFALILAGAFGNILDFFLYGHVIDMFHFILWGYDYPVFNIADISIFLGIIWVLICTWQEKSVTSKS